MRKTVLCIVILSLGLTQLSSATHSRDPAPVILSAVPDLEAGLLVITGDHLTAPFPGARGVRPRRAADRQRLSVTLNGQVLEVARANPQVIVARLPVPRPAPGTYLLTVAHSREADLGATFQVAIPQHVIAPNSSEATGSGSGHGTGGIPEVLRQLAVVQSSLAELRAEQMMLAEEVMVVQLDVKNHRRGTLDDLFDVDANWCFKLEGEGKVEPRTELAGMFDGLGFAGLDGYGNGFAGKVDMRTKGKIDLGWEAATGLGLEICVRGPVIKNTFLAQGDSIGKVPSTRDARLPSNLTDREQLAEDARAAAEALNDRLPDLLASFGLDATRFESAVDRAQAFDIELDNPTALLSSVKSLAQQQAVDLPLPAALRDRLNADEGILQKVSSRLSNPKQIFCELEQNADLPQSFRARMAKACEAGGEKLKDTLENIEDLAASIRAKLPKGRDPLIEALGVNDWKLGDDQP